MSQALEPVAVADLARLLQEWPHRGADGERTRVLIGGCFLEIPTQPMPLVAAGPIESDDGGHQNLILFPAARELPKGAIGPNATALDLALACIRYRQTVPPETYSPEADMALALRAVEAITRCQGLRI
jgi:hypothetical protein